MINLDKEKPVWLVDRSEIVLAFGEAARKVYRIYMNGADTDSRTAAVTRLNRFFNVVPLRSFAKLTPEDVEEFLRWTFKGEDVKPLNITGDRFIAVYQWHIPPFMNFLKMCFVQLWIDKKFLAPLRLTVPNKLDLILDNICLASERNALINIRKISKSSTIPYDSYMALQDRERKSSHWLRLLLSTTFYESKDLNKEDCQQLFYNGVGAKETLLSRYYVMDFMFTIAQGDDDAVAVVSSVAGKYDYLVTSQATERKKEREEKQNTAEYKKEFRDKERERRRSGRERARTERKDKEIELKQDLIDIAKGKIQISFDEFLSKKLDVVHLKNQYFLKSSTDVSSHPIYSELPGEVQALITIIASTYLGFIKSKRLQNPSTINNTFSMLLSYIAIYLPNFYFQRDGDLKEFPTTLNDFSCSMFITRQAIFENDALFSDKKLPNTFLTYINKTSDLCDWTSDTLYSRILPIEMYYLYLFDNRLVFPNAEHVTCTFTPACYPKLIKKTGTVKKTIPRAYFATYLNMLYALEYLVMHINGMAEGVNNGVVDGELYQPTYEELREHHRWVLLWGKPGNQIYNQVDLSLLNYTPIFYYNGKAYPFEFIPRFYRFADYEINGALVERIVPNDIRILITMSETGIRQHHIVWLDQDTYDSALDESIRSPLAPLLVNTDKAHGAWVSIVSSHLFPMLRRQKEWNLSCTSEEYKQKLWYGLQEGSKFGKFYPLFRLPLNKENQSSDNGWKAYESFKQTLFCLQYAIKIQISDLPADDFVFYKNEDKTLQEIDFSDFDELKNISRDRLSSKLTPHGLRAGFVSNAIRFLPASIVGQFFTGQTEQLVLYYKLFDAMDTPNHAELLAQLLSDNMNKLSKGEAPELAAAVMKVNAGLMAAIEKDPQQAIDDYRLMSLSGIEDKNGIDLLRAKRATKLAYNNTHICPFNNQCPKEVLDNYGYHACGICPFAIRGVAHLPAISAEKDKAKENVAGILEKLDQYKKLNQSAVNKENIEELNKEYDFAIREAYCLEAVEQQLYSMAKAGNKNELFLQNKTELLDFYEKINLSEGEHLIKRLIDVQNFPDVTSGMLDTKFAYLRSILLLKKGDMRELLKIRNEAPFSSVSSLIASMISAGEITTQQLFKISKIVTSPTELDSPEADIAKLLGFKKD